MSKNSGQAARQAKERTYLSQTDVPSTSLDKALRIPAAIGDNYGYKPTSPLQVAKALDVQPSTGGFRMLAGAAIAYGLTTGGYNADTISITSLGMRIVRPTAEDDDVAAKREALLRPRVIREFLQRYDGAPIPKDSIAQNVLSDLGVPPDRVAEVLHLILEGATSVGLLETIKDKKYVVLRGTVLPTADVNSSDPDEESREPEVRSPAMLTPRPVVVASASAPEPVIALTPNPDARFKKVFITHGKNKEFIEPIKKLLSFGELEPVVAAEKQTVSQPVPEKVMEDMRSCGAAIIHVEGERHLIDSEAKNHVVLNENVLIEIGGAMALYGRRFILVVKEGVTLPSNLQGLYEVRYTGETLDGSVTIKLMEAINDMKKRTLP
jgi:predicted nucleotide-binding protein